jgi:niacin transporter
LPLTRGISTLSRTRLSRERLRMNSYQVALAGLMSALALAIPLAFRGTLQFFLPAVGYSATLASHVPVMLSTLGGPFVAATVGLASTIGFLATLGPVVAARAATHILFGVAMAVALVRGVSLAKALLLIALPLHAVPEALVVIPFGVPIQGAIINLVGGAIHHLIDSFITMVVVRAAHPVLSSMNLPGYGKKR